MILSTEEDKTCEEIAVGSSWSSWMIEDFIERIHQRLLNNHVEEAENLVAIPANKSEVLAFGEWIALNKIVQGPTLKQVGGKTVYLTSANGMPYYKTIDELHVDFLATITQKTPAASPNTVVFAIFDSGGQGMRDVGLMGIFDNEQKARAEIGTRWLSIKEATINTLYENGI